jgi:hypothetical protein
VVLPTPEISPTASGSKKLPIVKVIIMLAVGIGIGDPDIKEITKSPA